MWDILDIKTYQVMLAFFSNPCFFLIGKLGHMGYIVHTIAFQNLFALGNISAFLEGIRGYMGYMVYMG